MWRSCIVLVIAATASVAQSVAVSAGGKALEAATCEVFLHPERFANQNVTVEATVNYPDDSESSLDLRPLKPCPGARVFWFVPQEKNLKITKEGRDFLKFLSEDSPLPEGVHCLGCLRYEISRIVATGELVPVRDLNKENNKSGLSIDFDRIGTPTYTLRISRVIEVSANERNYDSHDGGPHPANVPSRKDK